MTLPFSLQKFSSNGSNKEKIIRLLAERWPLSAKEILLKINKDYSTDVSYQAIHKILLELSNEKIIEKTGKEWKLKKEWLQKGEQFFKKSLDEYNGLINKYNITASFEGSKTFKFDNFSELAVKTAELLASKTLATNVDGYFICVMEFGWWTFKFKFEQLELLYRMVKNCPNSKNIIRKDTSFGRWIIDQYNKVNAISAPIGTQVDIDEELFVQGNYIIEVNISEEGKKIIEKYWNKWKSINDLFKEFGLKEEPKIEATVKITKNPEMAKFMRKELERYFQ